jgi:hypothetical protein
VKRGLSNKSKHRKEQKEALRANKTRIKRVMRERRRLDEQRDRGAR